MDLMLYDKYTEQDYKRPKIWNILKDWKAKEGNWMLLVGTSSITESNLSRQLKSSNWRSQIIELAFCSLKTQKVDDTKS